MSISSNPHEQDNLQQEKQQKKTLEYTNIYELNSYIKKVIENSDPLYKPVLQKMHDMIVSKIMQEDKTIDKVGGEKYQSYLRSLLDQEGMIINKDYAVTLLYNFEYYNPDLELHHEYPERDYRKKRKRFNQMNTKTLESFLNSLTEEKEIVPHEFRVRRTKDSKPERDKIYTISKNVKTFIEGLARLSSPTLRENYTYYIEEFYKKVIKDIQNYPNEIYTMEHVVKLQHKEVKEVNVELAEIYDLLYVKVGQQNEKKIFGKQLFKFSLKRESEAFNKLARNRDQDFLTFENRLLYLRMLIGK